MMKKTNKEIRKIKPIMKKVLSHEKEYSKLTDEELQSKTSEFKERLASGETLDDILPEAFAVCREASWRVIGLKHFPVQIIGGIVLHQGRIAEMRTGEGKTLAVTLPAYLNALTGKGVHIITVNDYLSRRDSEWMGKVYKFLGLTVGLVTSEDSSIERQYAYTCDITYGTSNEFGFDYLRDNMAKTPVNQVQREHNYIIIDEIDSVLIDEARTPLIISGLSGDANGLYKKADDFVKTLKGCCIKKTDQYFDIEAYADNGEDYIVQEMTKTVGITEKGVKKAEKFFGVENLMEPEYLELQHHINQALRAHAIMKRDIDYVVEDGKAQIVDENTGRIMYGRRYTDGLHQAIEQKEGIDVAGENKTFATITLQNYCKLYDKISGMSGTVETEQSEFLQTYGIDVVVVPTNKQVIRKDKNDLIYRTGEAKYKAVVEEIKRAHEKGQPVLVGTTTVENSEKLSKLLEEENVPHNVLNAKNHREEAGIIAMAGKYGAVTIATNMAGRGTDIKLGGNAEYVTKEQLKWMGMKCAEIEAADSFYDTDDETILANRERYQKALKHNQRAVELEAEKVKALGGLYVIGTERSTAKRIDNQLIGRAGRQGDPGESQFFVSLEDEVIRVFGSDKIEALFESGKTPDNASVHNRWLTKAIADAQMNIEATHQKSRQSTLAYDECINEQRKVMYKQRQEVVENKNVREHVIDMIHDSLIDIFDFYWTETSHDFDSLQKELMFFNVNVDSFNGREKEEVLSEILELCDGFYDEKCNVYGDKIMNNLERSLLLKFVDKYWQEYVDDVSFLKTGIKLWALSGKDPVVEFRRETANMFDYTVNLIKKYTAIALMNATPAMYGDGPMRPVMRTTVAPKSMQKK